MSERSEPVCSSNLGKINKRTLFGGNEEEMLPFCRRERFQPGLNKRLVTMLHGVNVFLIFFFSVILV